MFVLENAFSVALQKHKLLNLLEQFYKTVDVVIKRIDRFKNAVKFQVRASPSV